MADTEVYDKAHGELLILGEPGAGKTTLLLELARDLLDRAEQEQAHLIPVVFNLSSWTRKRQPLANFLFYGSWATLYLTIVIILVVGAE